jgi:hypothetical protein
MIIATPGMSHETEEMLKIHIKAMKLFDNYSCINRFKTLAGLLMLDKILLSCSLLWRDELPYLPQLRNTAIEYCIDARKGIRS